MAASKDEVMPGVPSMWRLPALGACLALLSGCPAIVPTCEEKVEFTPKVALSEPGTIVAGSVSEDRAVAFGRLLLDNPDDARIAVTVLRFSGDKPAAISAHWLSSDGRFHWSLEPGRYGLVSASLHTNNAEGRNGSERVVPLHLRFSAAGITYVGEAEVTLNPDSEKLPRADAVWFRRSAEDFAITPADEIRVTDRLDQELAGDGKLSQLDRRAVTTHLMQVQPAKDYEVPRDNRCSKLWSFCLIAPYGPCEPIF